MSKGQKEGKRTKGGVQGNVQGVTKGMKDLTTTTGTTDTVTKTHGIEDTLKLGKVGTAAHGYSTRVLHYGQVPEFFQSRSLVPPIVLSTSFEKCSLSSRAGDLSGGYIAGGKKVHGGVSGGTHDKASDTTTEGKGFLGRITDTLLGHGTKGESKTTDTTGTSGGGDLLGLPGARRDERVDTTGTGSPEAKATSPAEKHKPLGTLDTATTDETRGPKHTDGRRGGAHGVPGLGEMGVRRPGVEGEIGTFASTYESSFPGRGIPTYAHGLDAETHFGRMNNITRIALEQSLSTLEDSKYAIAFPSGTSALTACGFLLENGNHVLVLDEVYIDTAKFFTNCVSRMGVDVDFVDMTDLNATGGAVKPNTAMVWIETPTNPSLKIVDIKAVVEIVRRTNPRTIVVVDSTVATPFFQRPLELGADIVLHSLTKYINGHLDVVMGSLMTNRDDLYQKVTALQDTLGNVPSPFDCFLVNRSIKTFTIRMREHMNNALKIATYLKNHPLVLNLTYPGLLTHPHNDIYKRQMSGFGGLMSFTLDGSDHDIQLFMSSLKLFSCADNAGGYVSLVEQPAKKLIAQDIQPKYNPRLIRLSIGLEDADDLLNDLLTALDKVRVLKPTTTGARKTGGIGGSEADAGTSM